MKSKLMSTFWMAFAAIFLSLAWLLPNHSQPWLGFHGDAWAALMMSTVAIAVLWRTNFSVGWHGLTVVIAVLVLIPIAQFQFGLVPMFGTAWINSIYLLGFLLSLIVGASWESHSPGQGLDYLFLAIGVASFASVALQLHQLFELQPVGPWILQVKGTRHYANMAQPNQLASLLLLGVMSVAWGYYRAQISAKVALAGAAVLLFGVALTDSRTGWLNVSLIVLGSIVFSRKLGTSRAYLIAVVGLATYFLACVLVLPLFYEMLSGESMVKFRSPANDPRWAAWLMFLKAAIHRPLFGFGWGQLGQAQFLMLDEKLWLGASMLQSHNLFIDLILWNGFVVGLGIIVFLVYCCWLALQRISGIHQLFTMFFLMILATHAMLEYPLQYAYFLLPFGFVAGCFTVSLGFSPTVGVNRSLTGGVLLLSLIALTVTIHDYLRIETSFYGLRFEHRKIETTIPRAPPDVLVLTHYRDFIALARMEPRSGMSAHELERIRGLVSTIPSALGMYKMAAMLAVNGEVTEAQVWLRRVCQVTPVEQCEAVRIDWETKSLTNSSYAAIPWPVLPK